MRSRGFTLVELLVVMTISAILIAAAVPAFQWTIARNRIADATNLLQANLEYARMESSRRGNTISLCRTLDPNAAPACSAAASATVDGNDWATGWLVFEKTPPNADDTNFEAGDRLIFRQQVSTGEAVRVSIHSSIAAQRVAYLPRGTGQIAGAQTFAIRYGVAPTPAVANRALGTIPLTAAGRCIPITLVGSINVIRAGVGPCPAA
jgi:type IV fimbrial biogenesis protein FimT